MGHLLNVYGEEYCIQNGLDSGTTAWAIGLYDDASTGTTGDAISDGDDLAAITTEPAGTSYARQTDTFSPADTGADSLTESSTNDSALSFNVSDSSATVDSYFVVINFQASDETAASDHLVVTGALDAEYNLSNHDQLDFSAGDFGVSLE